MVLQTAPSLGLVLLVRLLEDRARTQDVSHGVFFARRAPAGLAVLHQDRNGDLAGRVVDIAGARRGTVVDVGGPAATVLQLLLGHGFLFRLAFALVPVVLEPDLHLRTVRKDRNGKKTALHFQGFGFVLSVWQHSQLANSHSQFALTIRTPGHCGVL